MMIYSPILSYREFYGAVYSLAISTNFRCDCLEFNYHGTIGPRYTLKPMVTNSIILSNY